MDMENDKDFHRLIERIENNYSPSVTWIKNDLMMLLHNHGYEWEDERLRREVVTRIDFNVSSVGSKGRESISDSKIEEIKKMHLEGHSLRFIANQLNVGKSTVGKYIK